MGCYTEVVPCAQNTVGRTLVCVEDLGLASPYSVVPCGYAGATAHDGREACQGVTMILPLGYWVYQGLNAPTPPVILNEKVLSLVLYFWLSAVGLM